MEYICLMLQIVLLLGNKFLPPNDPYLVSSNKIYRNYLIVEIIVQVLCIIANVILLFVFKKIMPYVLVLHVILMGLIKSYFCIKAKITHFQELERILKKEKEKILTFSSIEIRKYLLEKYEQVYSIKDIEKCLSKINN